MSRWAALLVACIAAGIGGASESEARGTHGTPAAEPWAVPPWPRWTRISIRTQPGAVRRLREHPRGWVPVEAAVDDGPAIPARMRIKGTRGSLRDVDAGPSFTVVTDRPLEGFGETTRLHLENGAEDPQSVRAAWAAHVFAVAGIPCPRHGWGTLQIDGHDMGWRGVKEGFDAAFAHRAWPGSDVVLGEPREGADVGDALDWKEAAGGDASIRWGALGEALRKGGWQATHPSMDGGTFRKFAAIEVLLGHRDGYALARNNYRVAWVDGRPEWVPWGLDTLLESPGLTVWPSMTGSMARAAAAAVDGAESWHAVLRRWAPVALDVGGFDAWRRECEASLRGRVGLARWREWQRNMEGLRSAITARAVSVESQLTHGPPRDALGEPGVISLSGWKAQGVPMDGGALGVVDSGGEQLVLKAGARNSSAWATTVRLAPGGYCFRGRVRVDDFKALQGARHQGACLRLAGRAERSRSLQEGCHWTELRVDFRVGQPRAEVTLLCELRAGGGRAGFDRASLLLERLE